LPFIYGEKNISRAEALRRGDKTVRVFPNSEFDNNRKNEYLIDVLIEGIGFIGGLPGRGLSETL